MDGGLERLVRILHDFCICPPPPDNGAVFYGLIPPHIRPSKPVPTLNPPQFDKQAAYRFSLAFQCVVNIGVRGSEPIRSRVVQAGTLDVVGCILEAWLANKGFAVGPSSSATGMPRETREQRQARRDAAAAAVAQRQREQQAELDRQRNRQPVTLRTRPPYMRLGDVWRVSLFVRSQLIFAPSTSRTPPDHARLLAVLIARAMLVCVCHRYGYYYYSTFVWLTWI